MGEKRSYVVVGDKLHASLHAQFDARQESVYTGKRDGTNRRLFRDPVRHKIFDMHTLQGEPAKEIISVSNLAFMQKRGSKEMKEKELHTFVFKGSEWSIDLLLSLQREGFEHKEWLYGAKEDATTTTTTSTRLRVIGQKYVHKRDKSITRNIMVSPGPKCNACTLPSHFFCRCSSATYCSRECYARDWDIHKLTCSKINV
jgi:hypothetical protein